MTGARGTTARRQLAAAKTSFDETLLDDGDQDLLHVRIIQTMLYILVVFDPSSVGAFKGKN